MLIWQYPKAQIGCISTINIMLCEKQPTELGRVRVKVSLLGGMGITVDLEHLECYLTNEEMVLFCIFIKNRTNPK